MKPESCLLLGVLVYFATIVLNRYLGERNYSMLTPEDKLKLTDEFKSHRSLATYIPIGILLVVIAVGYVNPHTFVVTFPVGVVLILIVSLSLQFTIFRRLNDLSLPDNFVAKFRIQSTLVQIGNIVALSMFAYGIVGRAA